MEQQPAAGKPVVGRDERLRLTLLAWARGPWSPWSHGGTHGARRRKMVPNHCTSFTLSLGRPAVICFTSNFAVATPRPLCVRVSCRGRAVG